MIQRLHDGREDEGHLLSPSHSVLPFFVLLQHICTQLPLRHSGSANYDQFQQKCVRTDKNVEGKGLIISKFSSNQSSKAIRLCLFSPSPLFTIKQRSACRDVTKGYYLCPLLADTFNLPLPTCKRYNRYNAIFFFLFCPSDSMKNNLQ